MIVAMDEAGGIGKGGGLAWHLSADLKNFKAVTMGHHLIVGRKTYELIGKALPGRTMIIVTHNRIFSAEGCLVTYTLEEALALAEQSGESEVFIGGGGEIFAQALPLAQRIYLTRGTYSGGLRCLFPTGGLGGVGRRGRGWSMGRMKRMNHDFTYSVV